MRTHLADFIAADNSAGASGRYGASHRMRRFPLDRSGKRISQPARHLSEADIRHPEEISRMSYEAICKARIAEPDRFRANPLHQMPRPNTCVRTLA